MNGGRLIAVVGPSGVGKDSLIDGLIAAAPALRRVRRVITRDAALGGEDFDPATPEAFAEAVQQGAFCLHWAAHGMQYGLPAGVLQTVRGGADCVANLSRSALPRAAEVFPRLVVLNVIAAPEVLDRRLAGRGRETAEEIAGRLAQASKPLPSGLDVVTVVNDGPLEHAVAQALAALQKERA